MKNASAADTGLVDRPMCVTSSALSCAEELRLETEGAVTWRLVGIPETDSAGAATRAALDALGAHMPTSLETVGAASYDQSLRTTADGVWVAYSVDGAYGEEILAEVFERNRSFEDRSPGPDEPESMPTRNIIPTSWEGSELLGNPLCSAYKWLAWNGDNRATVSPPYNDRQSSVVRVSGPGGGGSGVMLDEEWVLTVSHAMSTNAPYTCPGNMADISVTLPSSGQTRTAASCTIATGSGELGATDVAIIRLTSPFSASHGTMILSDASNVVLEAEAARVLGFPSKFDTTGFCSATSSLVRSPNADVIDVTTIVLGRGEVHTRNDNSQGQSGGPIFYCPANPNNNCTSGDVANVFGVTSGFVTNGQSSYNLGAKIPGFYHDYIHGLEPTLP